MDQAFERAATKFGILSTGHNGEATVVRIHLFPLCFAVAGTAGLALSSAILMAQSTPSAEAKKPAASKTSKLSWLYGQPLPNVSVRVKAVSGGPLSRNDFKLKLSDGKKALMDDPSWFWKNPDDVYFNLSVPKYGVENTWTVLYKDKPIATGKFTDFGGRYVAGPSRVLDSAWTVSNPQLAIGLGYANERDGKLKSYIVVYEVIDASGKVFKCNTITKPLEQKIEAYGWYPQDFTPKTDWQTGKYKWKMSVPAYDTSFTEGTMTVKVNKGAPGEMDIEASTKTTVNN